MVIPMRFGAGLITVAGSLGILMLPSIPKIVYAISTNTSIGALFVAGLLPGLAADRTDAVRRDVVHGEKPRLYPTMQRATWGECWQAFRRSVWGLMLVVIIIGGIYSGIFTRCGSRRDGRRVFVHRVGLRLQGLEARQRATRRVAVSPPT